MYTFEGVLNNYQQVVNQMWGDCVFFKHLLNKHFLNYSPTYKTRANKNNLFYTQYVYSTDRFYRWNKITAFVQATDSFELGFCSAACRCVVIPCPNPWYVPRTYAHWGQNVKSRVHISTRVLRNTSVTCNPLFSKETSL